MDQLTSLEQIMIDLTITPAIVLSPPHVELSAANIELRRILDSPPYERLRMMRRIPVTPPRGVKKSRRCPNAPMKKKQPRKFRYPLVRVDATNGELKFSLDLSK